VNIILISIQALPLLAKPAQAGPIPSKKYFRRLNIFPSTDGNSGTAMVSHVF
jgi:hypothetical protein